MSSMRQYDAKKQRDIPFHRDIETIHHRDAVSELRAVSFGGGGRQGQANHTDDDDACVNRRHRGRYQRRESQAPTKRLTLLPLNQVWQAWGAALSRSSHSDEGGNHATRTHASVSI